MALNVRSRDWRGEPVASLCASAVSPYTLFQFNIPVRTWRTYSPLCSMRAPAPDRRNLNCVHLKEVFYCAVKGNFARMPWEFPLLSFVFIHSMQRYCEMSWNLNAELISLDNIQCIKKTYLISKK